MSGNRIVCADAYTFACTFANALMSGVHGSKKLTVV